MKTAKWITGWGQILLLFFLGWEEIFMPFLGQRNENKKLWDYNFLLFFHKERSERQTRKRIRQNNEWISFISNHGFHVLEFANFCVLHGQIKWTNCLLSGIKINTRSPVPEKTTKHFCFGRQFQNQGYIHRGDLHCLQCLLYARRLQLWFSVCILLLTRVPVIDGGAFEPCT